MGTSSGIGWSPEAVRQLSQNMSTLAKSLAGMVTPLNQTMTQMAEHLRRGEQARQAQTAALQLTEALANSPSHGRQRPRL